MYDFLYRISDYQTRYKFISCAILKLHVPPKFTKFQFVILIVILQYLGAKFDHDYLILFSVIGVH